VTESGITWVFCSLCNVFKCLVRSIHQHSCG